MLPIVRVPTVGAWVSTITTYSFEGRLYSPDATPVQLFGAIDTFTSPSRIAWTSKLYATPSPPLKLAIVAFSKTISSCVKLDNTKIIRLGHGLSTTHSVHQAMEYMDSILRVESNGKMKIQIYPSEQLGTERQCLELLQIGSLDMTKVSTGSLENFSPNIKVFGLPFLFGDREHSYSVLDGPIGKDLLLGTEKYWLKGLAYYDAGARSFYSKEKKINSPKDLEGLKIRVMESKTAFDMVKALGGSPTPISFGELYTSLQQGVVDGAENNPPSFYLSRHYEVCKFYTLDEHTVLPDVLLMSTHMWDSFSDQEKKWLDKGGRFLLPYPRFKIVRWKKH